MRIRLSLFLSMGYFLIAWTTKAQNKDLVWIKDHIQENHPLFLARKNSVQSLHQQAEGAKSWDAPQVGFGFFMTPYQSMLWKPNTMEDPNGMPLYSPGMGQWMFQFQQMLPNPWAQQHQYRLAQFGATIENEKIKKEMYDRFLMAKGLVLEQIYFSKKYALSFSIEKRAEEAFQIAQRTYATEETNLNDLFKAENAYLTKKNETIEVLAAWRNAKSNLLSSLQLADTSAFVWDTSWTFQQYESKVLDSNQIQTKNYDSRLLQLQVEELKLQQQAEKSSLYPTLGLRYDHMVTFGAQPPLFTFMGMVNVPFVPWARKKSVSTLKSLEIQRQTTQSNQVYSQKEVLQEWKTYQEQLALKHKQRRLLTEKLIPQLQKNVAHVWIGYQQNKYTWATCFEAIQDVQLAQEQALDLWKEAATLELSMEKYVSWEEK